MALSTHDKQISETWRLRFLRRAKGRIGKRDARELGIRWRDLAMRFANDNLEGHTPFAEAFADAKKYGADAVWSFGQSRRDRFFFYGASYGAFERDRPFETCPCGCVAYGRFYEPSLHSRLARGEELPEQPEGMRFACHAHFFAVLNGSGSGCPGLARTSERPDSLEAEAV